MPRTRSRALSAARATASCFDCLPIAAAASSIFFCSASRFAPIDLFHRRAHAASRRRALQRALRSSGSSRGCACRGCCPRLRRACAPRPSRRARIWLASFSSCCCRSATFASIASLRWPTRLRLRLRGRRRLLLSRPLTSEATSFCSFASSSACALRAAGRRARRGRSGCARAAAAPRAAGRAPGWPARRRPSIRSPPRAASRRPRPAARFIASLSSWPLLVARQLLELARAPSRLPRRAARWLALDRRRCWPDCAMRRCRSHLLLLAARQLLQLLDQLIDLLVAALLLGALLHLMLVRELVELELEEIGEVLGHRVLAAAAAAAALLLRRPAARTRCSASCSSFSARCSGDSASSAFIAFRSASAAFISSAAFGSASAILLNAGSTDAEPRLQLADELLDLLAQLRLREVEEHDVLAELVRPWSWPCRGRC